jgi:hypothetical protein
MPLFEKGREIFELTLKISELIPEDDQKLVAVKAMMLEDAALLSAKVVGAEGGDLYDIRMECATLVRKAARDLQNHCHTLTMFSFAHTHYLHLIREALEEFRLLFVDWVQNFDKWNYVVDRWGLFNPPGVQASDADNDKEPGDDYGPGDGGLDDDDAF